MRTHSLNHRKIHLQHSHFFVLETVWLVLTCGGKRKEKLCDFDKLTHLYHHYDVEEQHGSESMMALLHHPLHQPLQ